MDKSFPLMTIHPSILPDLPLPSVIAQPTTLPSMKVSRLSAKEIKTITPPMLSRKQKKSE